MSHETLVLIYIIVAGIATFYKPFISLSYKDNENMFTPTNTWADYDNKISRKNWIFQMILVGGCLVVEICYWIFVA
jgi:hypothetical protein